jgi:1-acyl-sn-glycerol-3-phosphate acyltransferase
VPLWQLILLLENLLFKKVVYSGLDYSIFLLSIILGFILAAYPAYIIATLRNKNGRAEFQRVTKYVFQIMFFLSPSIRNINIIGKEHLAAYDNFVITPTHRSFIDYLLIEFTIHNLVLLTNKPLTRLFIYRHVSNLLGAHTAMDNSPASYFKLFDDFKKHLENDTNVLIFPEGSRNSTEKLLPFKEGAFKLSISANVPVLPIMIIGSDKVYKKGSMLRTSSNAEDITMVVLEPVFANKNESSKEFALRIHDHMQANYRSFSRKMFGLPLSP